MSLPTGTCVTILARYGSGPPRGCRVLCAMLLRPTATNQRTRSSLRRSSPCSPRRPRIIHLLSLRRKSDKYPVACVFTNGYNYTVCHTAHASAMPSQIFCEVSWIAATTTQPRSMLSWSHALHPRVPPEIGCAKNFDCSCPKRTVVPRESHARAAHDLYALSRRSRTLRTTKVQRRHGVIVTQTSQMSPCRYRIMPA